MRILFGLSSVAGAISGVDFSFVDSLLPLPPFNLGVAPGAGISNQSSRPIISFRRKKGQSSMRRDIDSSASKLEIDMEEDLTTECTTADSRKARLSWFEEAGPENNIQILSAIFGNRPSKQRLLIKAALIALKPSFDGEPLLGEDGLDAFDNDRCLTLS